LKTTLGNPRWHATLPFFFSFSRNNKISCAAGRGNDLCPEQHSEPALERRPEHDAADRNRYHFTPRHAARHARIITNACPYYPDDPDYKDRSPTAKELKCCAPILEDQIVRIRPQLIVALGNVALEGLRYVFPDSRQLKQFRLKHDIGSVISDTTPPIYPVYHTSSRARVTRGKNEQAEDWRKILQYTR